MEYDTTKIRRIAKMAHSAAADGSSPALKELRTVSNNVLADFRGSAADALKWKVEELLNDIKKIDGALNGVSDELYAFANRLDEADRKSSGVIRGQ